MRDLDQGADGLVGEVDDAESVGQGDEDAARLRRGRGADPDAERDRAIVIALGIEDVQHARLDVDPEQPSRRRIPARAFAQQRPGMDRDLHRERLARMKKS